MACLNEWLIDWLLAWLTACLFACVVDSSFVCTIDCLFVCLLAWLTVCLMFVGLHDWMRVSACMIDCVLTCAGVCLIASLIVCSINRLFVYCLFVCFCSLIWLIDWLLACLLACLYVSLSVFNTHLLKCDNNDRSLSTQGRPLSPGVKYNTLSIGTPPLRHCINFDDNIWFQQESELGWAATIGIPLFHQRWKQTLEIPSAVWQNWTEKSNQIRQNSPGRPSLNRWG